jgi:nucleotide-binding universal stress UspA family protein
MSGEEESIFVSPAISGLLATFCLMFSREEAKKSTPFPTRVLLVVDGIKVSGLATRIALEITSGTDSELHLVCPVLTTPQRPYPRSFAKERSEAILEQRRLLALGLLEEHARLIEEAGGKVAAKHYREGEPEDEVVELAKELDAGMIVVPDGSREVNGVSRLLSRRLSDALVRRAKRTVMVVRW